MGEGEIGEGGGGIGTKGPTLENMQRFDAQVNQEYMTRYATGAHEMLAAVTPDQIKSSVKEYETSFGGRKNILASVQSLAMFARSNVDPEAILTAIGRDAEDFAKDSPTEHNDGTWEDVRTMNELMANSPLGNITALLWEKTATVYKDRYGKMPETEEEKQRFEDAKVRAKTTKVI